MGCIDYHHPSFLLRGLRKISYIVNGENNVYLYTYLSFAEEHDDGPWLVMLVCLMVGEEKCGVVLR